MHRKYYLLLLLCLFSLSNLRAESSPISPKDFQTQFGKANSLYAAEQFAEAAQIYSALSQSGLVSADLYYNWANALEKTGDHGKAVLNYQRALIVDPHFTRARKNLRNVYTELGLTQEAAQLNKTTGWNTNLQKPTVRKTLLWILSLSFWALLMGLLLFFWKKLDSRMKVLSYMLLTISLIGMVVSGLLILIGSGGMKWNYVHNSVVTSSPAPVHSTPIDNGNQVATLIPGTMVEVIVQRGPWSYIKFGTDTSMGWIRSDKLENVVPTKQLRSDSTIHQYSQYRVATRSLGYHVVPEAEQ